MTAGVVFIKTLIFTVIVPGTGTVAVPYLLLRCGIATVPRQRGLPAFFGLLPLALGASVYFRCAWDFAVAGQGTPAPIDPPKSLVVSGLYRHVRNPMYLGILLLLSGEALFFQSAALAWYAVALALGFHLFVVSYEEPTLRRTFGSTYEDYCTVVGRWVPRRRPYLEEAA